MRLGLVWIVARSGGQEPRPSKGQQEALTINKCVARTMRLPRRDADESLEVW